MKFTEAYQKLTCGACTAIKLLYWKEEVIKIWQNSDSPRLFESAVSMTEPFLYVDTGEYRYPYTPSAIELMSDLWEIVEIDRNNYKKAVVEHILPKLPSYQQEFVLCIMNQLTDQEIAERFSITPTGVKITKKLIRDRIEKM